MPAPRRRPLSAARRGQVPPFIVMDVMQAAAEREAAGKDVVHMEVGQPGTGAPRGVIEAAREAAASQRAESGQRLACGQKREMASRSRPADSGNPKRQPQNK